MNADLNGPDEEPRTGERGPAAEAGIVDQQDAVLSEMDVDERQKDASETGDPDAPGNFVNDDQADDVPEPNEPG